MAPRGTAASRPAGPHLCTLSVAHPGESAARAPRLPEDVLPPSGARAAVREGPAPRLVGESWPPGGPPSDPVRPGAAPTRSVPAWAPRLGAALPPFGHAGTARRIARPQEAAELRRGERGQHTCPTGQPGRLSYAARISRVWSGPYAGSTHDQRMADAPPLPCPRAARGARIWDGWPARSRRARG
jgi:hypothetical protein